MNAIKKIFSMITKYDDLVSLEKKIMKMEKEIKHLNHIIEYDSKRLLKIEMILNPIEQDAKIINLKDYI